MEQNQLAGIGATRIAVGLSACIRVQAGGYQAAESLKIFSGGGTLEICPLPIALSGGSFAGWGTGYPVGANEIINIGGPAAFYLCATGATMVVAMTVGFTNGVTLI